MAQISIRRPAAAEGMLPARCLCCGKPTDGFVMKEFGWSPGADGPGITIGRLHVFYKLVGAEERRVTTWMRVPLCPLHQDHWTWRAWLYWGTAIGNLVLLAVVVYHEAHAMNGKVTVQLPLPVLVSMALSLSAAGVAWLTSIRALEITKEYLVLAGVSAEFKAALDNGEQPANRGDSPSGSGSR
jgi:hypothetical protein